VGASKAVFSDMFVHLGEHAGRALRDAGKDAFPFTTKTGLGM
jgi:hypothetical protein